MVSYRRFHERGDRSEIPHNFAERMWIRDNPSV